MTMYDLLAGKYMKPTGEVLNATPGRTYERFRSRHTARCRTGDLADKLTRITDKYLPLVASDSRVFVMRFREKVPKLLKKACKIRRRIKAKKQGDAKKVPVQSPRRGMKEQHVTKEDTKKVPVQLPRGGKTEQHVTKEHDEDQESIPDWGDDAMDTTENLEPANTADVAEGHDLASIRHRGKRWDPRPTPQRAQCSTQKAKYTRGRHATPATSCATSSSTHDKTKRRTGTTPSRARPEP